MVNVKIQNVSTVAEVLMSIVRDVNLSQWESGWHHEASKYNASLQRWSFVHLLKWLCVHVTKWLSV
jgi:hypothetical protein